jgi:Protein of unknown function (DUF3465)
MRRFFIIALLAFVGYAAWDRYDLPGVPAASPDAGESTIVSAFRERASGIQVSGTGVATKILSDDNKGSRHQRFILELPSGQTLLVMHNIDLAPRIRSLRVGDTVEFNGVYEWNAKGGVVHWTHHDPQGRHEGGWLRHQGRTYE